MAASNKFYCIPEDGEETLPCPYNSSHMVPASMHSFHVRHCPQKNNEGSSEPSGARRDDRANGRSPKEEDWEPDIVPGKPGYVPLMSMVRPFFREVHSMTQVQRRRYYDELLKQHKVVSMLKSLANKSCFGQTRRSHTLPNNAHLPSHPLHIPTKHSTADLDDWYIEPMLTSLSSRLESILMSAERQPTSPPEYFCDLPWRKMKPSSSSLSREAANHPSAVPPQTPRVWQWEQTPERRKPDSVPSSTTSSPASDDAAPSAGGDAYRASSHKLQATTAAKTSRTCTKTRNSAVVSLRRIERETAKWVRAGDSDDEPFYCSGKGRGRVRM